MMWHLVKYRNNFTFTLSVQDLEEVLQVKLHTYANWSVVLRRRHIVLRREGFVIILKL
jgi:hypothetical protein